MAAGNRPAVAGKSQRKDNNANRYARVLSEKKSLYAEYRQRRKQMQEYTVARKNVEMLLEIDPEKEEMTTFQR